MFLRYLFDLTTTAQWHGTPVGILRVEQELARRSRRFLGTDVAFCLYDRSRSAIRLIDDALAAELIAGRMRIDFSEPPPTQVLGSPLRRKLRRVLLQNATFYYCFQRARGRVVTRDQILQIQAREVPSKQTGQVPAEERSGPDTIPITKFHRAALDRSTMIISGGLDWQYKDLRSLWHLKQSYGFSYCAVIHDLIAIRFPQFVLPGYTDLLTDYFGELAWLADLTMCNSQTTMRDWICHTHELGAEPVHSEVFPLGCDVLAAKDTRARLPASLQGKEFALYVSTIDPRKNHAMLYRSWEECIRTRQVDPEHHRLVFVGREGWASGDLLREMRTNPLTRDTIIILHDLADDELAELYRSCSIVLFPSMYEGFGLPLAEALGFGKLCVSSNAGALSEIGGELVIRLDPKDTLAWSRMIGRLFSLPSEVRDWETRIRRGYQPVTWDDAAKVFFDAVLSSAPSNATRHSQHFG